MAKVLLKIYDIGVHRNQLWFYCPGCKCVHAISTEIHKFNGDFDKPTFRPSVDSPERLKDKQRCHAWITEGKIQYLHDCYHELKNQIVTLPDIEFNEEKTDVVIKTPNI